jgi:hypothetical protein
MWARRDPARRGETGWDLMLAHYDRESDWGLEICDKPLDENGECPVETLKLTFPDALERMLKEMVIR